MLGDDCDDCDAIFTTFRVNSEEFESKVARRTGQHYIGLTQGSTGVRTRGTDVLFSSCRPEAAQTGSANRDRRPVTAGAVGRRHRRSFGARLGGSDRDRDGAVRAPIARTGCPPRGILIYAPSLDEPRRGADPRACLLRRFRRPPHSTPTKTGNWARSHRDGSYSRARAARNLCMASSQT